MSASSRLLARLLPLALPLTVACGAKSELLQEDPDDNGAARAGTGGTAGTGGAGGRIASGGNASTAGTGGSVSASGGSFSATGGTGSSDPVAAAGSGSGGTAGVDLPTCPVVDGGCNAACYAGAPDEPCLPSSPPEPVFERFGCTTVIAGSTNVSGQKPDECCYIVGFCGGGRPLFADGRALVAPLRSGPAWL